MDSKKDKKITFKIDKVKHEIRKSQNPVTGQFLRDLPPIITEEYDLWLRSHGHEDDTIINPSDSLDVKEGYHFYTSKKIITPGENE